ALRRGIQQVAEGDLTTEVPVDRDDELGNVTTHFNHMTRVLRDRAEEQGRFAAAGELLDGVAHEVNNPLMAIASHAELRLADANLPADQRNEMQNILRQVQRAAKLLRGLLEAGRRDAGMHFLLWRPTPGQALRSGPTVVPQAAGAPSLDTESLAGIRVLLLDDEELVRRPMARFLTRQGAQIREAGDGEA